MKLDIDGAGPIYWNGEARPRPRRRSRRRSSAPPRKAVQPEVHLRPDKAAKYEVVALVMASAQRLGLTKIGIVGSEQFIEIARRRRATSRERRQRSQTAWITHDSNETRSGT